MLVMSTITLCLAKPRWDWLREKNNDEKLNDEEATRKIQNDDKNVKKEWKKSACDHPTCAGGGRKRKINY